MTDLTEQWHKGELVNGKKYYITFFDSEPFEATFRCYEAMFPYWKFEANGKQYCDENGYDCVKVLAPVPSYEEWQDLKSKLQLKDTAYDFDTARLEEQNKQLKDLLKDCFEYIDWTDGTGLPISQQELLDKINEALR